MIILITFFCCLKMEWLCGEVPQKIIPYDIIEWNY
jgi:hypothetical protein